MFATGTSLSPVRATRPAFGTPFADTPPVRDSAAAAPAVALPRAREARETLPPHAAVWCGGGGTSLALLQAIYTFINPTEGCGVCLLHPIATDALRRVALGLRLATQHGLAPCTVGEGSTFFAYTFTGGA